MTTLDLTIAILLMGSITFGQKLFPFIALNSLTDNPKLDYVAKYMPPAVMLVLVIFTICGHWCGACLASLKPVIACVITALIHMVWRQALISIALGTISFELLKKFL